jgi:hypothetical protein
MEVLWIQGKSRKSSGILPVIFLAHAQVCHVTKRALPAAIDLLETILAG